MEDNFGNIEININGNGFIKEMMISELRKSLSKFQGGRKLIVDGVEVNPYK